MKKMIYFFIILMMALGYGFLYGQGFAPVGTAAAQFLEIGIGARAAGMGSAYTVMTNDAASTFWNPAGLAEVEHGNFFSSYTKWPAEITLVGVSYAYNVKHIGVFAISSLYLMTDDMEVTTIYQPEGTGEMFNIGNYSVGLSFARSLTDRFSIGLTSKMVHEKYWNYGYTTWAVDLGTLYRTSFHGLRLGMSILHFGPDVRYSGTFLDYSDPKSVDAQKEKKFNTFSLPVNFRFGVAMELLNNQSHRLTTAVDMVHPNNNTEQYSVGMEYGFRQLFFLRGGYHLNADEGGLAMGVGIRSPWGGNLGLAFDYSYTDLGILTSAHRISLSVSH